MNDMNSLVIIGRLTKDAQYGATGGGMTVAKFSIAVNRGKKQEDGSYKDEASFFDCVFLGKSADGVKPYLTKGRQVCIRGEIRQSRWEQDGQSRSKVEIFVADLNLLSAPAERKQEPQEAGPESWDDSDIPF